MYAVGRLLAELYYREFGLTATSAGLATTDIVGQAAGSAIWLVLLSAPGLIFAFFIARRGVEAGPRPKRETPERSDDESNVLPTTLGLLTVLAIFGAPIGAVFALGDPGRIGDYGIPVAAIGLGVVAFSAARVSHLRFQER
jgi:hypothetical protein